MALRFSVYAFRKLGQRDFRILSAIERGMSKYMYVPIEEISRLSGLEPEYVETRLKVLNSLGLVQRKKGAYIGFILTSRGYDCLALNALVKRGVLESISTTPLGVGKEADVYVGVTPSNREVAVKFHRAGRTSFRGIKLRRTYIGEREHISWLYMSRLAAKNEYEALKILSPAGVSVPKPIDWNRHVVVSELIRGIELSEVPSLTDPRHVMDEIIVEIQKAYKRAGIVHGDLSEYNILITVEEERPVIFDWPQWVSSSHPSAVHLLKRDIRNILKFFKRKYHLDVDVEAETSEIISNMLGEGA